ncbi:PREDICTED: uncharacterized protein LOC109332451 [Lupinus angustifolius]|uniref:uncharacterized protein LOC109332451 n=1 Tax=Lupinus angustifolius TaxID=3871 RepID=UPI00092EABA1|nr:PREDICTED: uncharacterized protein LOC109332451 [Lupinus angustifolius]
MNRSSSIKKTRMQALSIILLNTFNDSKEFTPISMKPNEDLNSNLKLEHEEENYEEHEVRFSCPNPQGMLIFADEIFDNGQILPIFRILDQSALCVDSQNKETLSLRPPLKKVFVEHQNSFSSKLDCKYEEPFNKWSEEMTILKVETSYERCKKSSSTGFSKHLRIRKDMKLRSNSEGDDTFILMNPSSSAPPKQLKFNYIKDKNVTKKKTKEEEHKMGFSAFEKHYRMRKTRKDCDKRRSFLPYKQVMKFANSFRSSSIKKTRMQALFGFSNERCKKSNTNGFSKKLRFRWLFEEVEVPMAFLESFFTGTTKASETQ